MGDDPAEGWQVIGLGMGELMPMVGRGMMGDDRMGRGGGLRIDDGWREWMIRVGRMGRTGAGGGGARRRMLGLGGRVVLGSPGEVGEGGVRL